MGIPKKSIHISFHIFYTELEHFTCDNYHFAYVKFRILSYETWVSHILPYLNLKLQMWNLISHVELLFHMWNWDTSNVKRKFSHVIKSNVHFSVKWAFLKMSNSNSIHENTFAQKLESYVIETISLRCHLQYNFWHFNFWGWE